MINVDTSKLVRADGFAVNDGCATYDALLKLRLRADGGLPPPNDGGRGAGRYVGYASPNFPPVGSGCTGVTSPPYNHITLLAPQASGANHELGHTLGLGHSVGVGVGVGVGVLPAADQEPLKYGAPWMIVGDLGRCLAG